MSFRTDRYTKLLLAVVGLVGGLILIFNPNLTARWFCRAMGIVALVCGGVRLYHLYWQKKAGASVQREVLIRAAADVVVGILLIFLTRHVLNVIAVVCGVFLIWLALLMLRHAMDARALNDRGWSFDAVLAGVAALVGLLMVIFGFCVVDFAIRLLGIALTALSALECWTIIRELHI